VLEHEWKQAIVEDGVVRYELHPDGDDIKKSFKHGWSRNNMSHNGSHIAAPSISIAYHSGFGHTAVPTPSPLAHGKRERT
jgi:hypothetical protein